MAKKTILVTGGCGFIGSHTAVELLKAGYEVFLIDNLSNSSSEPLERIPKITGGRKPHYAAVDMCDCAAMQQFFASAPRFDAVIHFAAFKNVGESVGAPLHYFRNNLSSGVNLLRCMEQFGCRSLVFSSSCTVYGDAKTVPIDERAQIGPATNPYGRTKIFMEEMLRDVAKHSKKPWRIVLLRYFNPIGAHPSGLIGEHARSPFADNVVPLIAQVATGSRKHLSIFGSDYPTPDGTCVRDYIHVVDLALGHLAALKEAIFRQPTYPAGFSAVRDPMNDGPAPNGCYPNGSYIDAFNLGTGKGVSVLELLNAYSQAAGKKLPYVLAPRRAGDAAQVFAQPAKVQTVLHWNAQYSVEDACRDSFNWKSKNPNGYSLSHNAAARGLQMKLKAKL